MVKFIRQVFGLCQHKWKEIDRQSIVRSDTKAVIGDRRVLQCEHCGNMKEFKTWL